jgi:flagellar biosynthetic protein FliP
VNTTRTTRPLWLAALTDRHFVVHYLQMLVAMGIGMGALMPLTMLAGDDAPTELRAVLMATSMIAGMAAWMAWRRHSRRAIAEMALAMYLSFVVLFPLLWVGVLSEGWLIVLGHVLMLPAMALAMLLRPHEYLHRP